MAILKNYPDTTTPLTVEKLLDFFHPIGSYYDTSDASFDPNVEWGGTWELDADGTVLASKSSTNGSPFNVNVGTIIGEDKHTLTAAEMPKHSHAPNSGATTFAGSGYSNDAAQTTGSRTYEFLSLSPTGGDQPHNNIQRTKIVNRWHRTA